MTAPAVERLGDGRWLARVAHPLRKGERVRVYGSTPAQVLERARDVRALRARHRCGEVSTPAALAELQRLQGGAARLTVAALWLPYVSALREPWRSKVRGIWFTRLNHFADCLAGELTAAALEDWWIGCVRAGVCDKTIANALGCLVAAYRMSDHFACGALPWGRWRPRYVSAPRVREACRDLDELGRLVDAARLLDVSGADAAGDLGCRVLVGALTGLRQGELAALGWDDLEIEGEAPLLRVRRATLPGWVKSAEKGARPSALPKGRRERVQLLHVDAAAALVLHRDRLRKLGQFFEAGPVFPALGGGYRAAPCVIRPEVLRRCVEIAALPNGDRWTTHSLRHTFATLEASGSWASSGDLRGAMTRTGHARVETLTGYLHAAGRGLARSAIGRLPESGVLEVATQTTRRLVATGGGE